MSALALGLVAAVCWGFHDVCVRFLSQRTPISACIFVVLLTGLVFHLGLMTIWGGFTSLPLEALWPALIAGVFFVIATFGLYGAFQRGPVRLVAPLIASYPILSVLWAVWSGAEVSMWQWAAVLAIILGVSVVAALSDPVDGGAPAKGRTIVYALIAAAGFAGTFAFGQAAAEMSADLPSTLATRLMALGLTVAIVLWLKLPFWPGRGALGFLIAMGVADGIALFAVLSAGGMVDAQYASVASSMFGLLTILMAWILLREPMTAKQWAGCVVAFCGVGYLAL